MKMFTGGKSFVSSPPAFSNDAKLLLVCTGNTVSIFSTSTGLQTSELEGHEAQVTSVVVVPATTPASKLTCYCWTASLDGKINYWDFASPELMRTIDIRLPIHSMVIPRFSSQTLGSGKKLFAYVYVDNAKEDEEQPNHLRGQIRLCNLNKSRLINGLNLAETEKPGSITGSPSGKYIGMYAKRTITIWELPPEDSDNLNGKKIRLHHTKSITALAFHPTGRVVAAGDITGRILIWRGVGLRGLNNAEDRPGVRGNDDADSCTTWHWHSSQVNFLFFSTDGAYLYSGGMEGVLVVWQLDTGKKKFLPRIGSPLLSYIHSPDPSMCSISCADNRIQLLRMPSMEVLKTISGIKLPSSHKEMYEGFGSSVVFNNAAGLIAVPTENYRVQFYSLYDDREISQVQICERNHRPGDEITVKVNLVALSPDGFTMSTVETRLPEEGIGSLLSLKFWTFSSQNKQFSLSTVIYNPHREAGISSIAFRPTQNMAVSTSYGGDFKVWVRKHELPQKDQELQNSGWTCHALGSYKKKPMNTAAFSSDGSVLAVAADNVITLWDPDSNTLVAVIGDSLEPITKLSFVGKSEYLIAASGGSYPRFAVCSMLKLCTVWSYRLHIEAIACSTDNSTFAVLAHSSINTQQSAEVTSKGADSVILLFNAENPIPLSTWFVSKAHGGGLSFVHSGHQSNDFAAETNSANEVLAYVNGAREYVLFNPNGELATDLGKSRKQNFSSLEEAEKLGYASIYGELPEFSLKPTEQTSFPSVPSDNTWKTIFSGPSHSLPPLPKLCSDFLESLLERRPAVIGQ